MPTCLISCVQIFSSIDELLCKAPMVRSSSSLTRAEQQHRWQQWRRECISRRDAGDFVALPQLQLLARVSVHLTLLISKSHHLLSLSPLLSCCVGTRRYLTIQSEYHDVITTSYYQCHYCM